MTPDDKKMLEEIHSVIVGNEKLRQKGIIERVEILELNKSNQKLRDAKLTGVIIGVLFGLQKAWDWVKQFI